MVGGGAGMGPGGFGGLRGLWVRMVLLGSGRVQGPVRWVDGGGV